MSRSTPQRVLDRLGDVLFYAAMIVSGGILLLCWFWMAAGIGH